MAKDCMMKFEKAQNPRWANAEKTMIDLIVKHPIFGEIPFTGCEQDTEEQGRDLFARAVAFEFGTVADYEPRRRTETPKPIEGTVQDVAWEIT